MDFVLLFGLVRLRPLRDGLGTVVQRPVIGVRQPIRLSARAVSFELSGAFQAASSLPFTGPNTSSSIQPHKMTSYLVISLGLDSRVQAMQPSR